MRCFIRSRDPKIIHINTYCDTLIVSIYHDTNFCLRYSPPVNNCIACWTPSKNMIYLFTLRLLLVYCWCFFKSLFHCSDKPVYYITIFLSFQLWVCQNPMWWYNLTDSPHRKVLEQQFIPIKLVVCKLLQFVTVLMLRIPVGRAHHHNKKQITKDK